MPGHGPNHNHITLSSFTILPMLRFFGMET